MSLGAFMKRNLGEYLLVLASAWAVATVGFDAFFLFSISDALGWWGRAGLALAVEAVLLLVLYAASWRRSRAVVGALAYVALAAVLVAVALALSTGGEEGAGLYEDVEGNYLYAVVVLLAAATGCFLFTRTLAGSAVWFVAAALVCAVVQAFYESEELLFSVLAALSALALIVHRNFKLGLEQAELASSPSHAGVFASALVPTCVVVAAALALWFAVIAPLSPGVLDVKLITEYRTLPIEEYVGTADEKPQLDTSLTSEEIVDGFSYTTDDLLKDPTSSVEVNSEDVLEQQLQEQLSSEGSAEGGSTGSGASDTIDEDSLDEEWEGQSYSKVFPYAWVGTLLVVLAIALVLCYFVGRRVWRRKRLERMLALQQPAAQVKAIYRFLLSRLARLGFSQPPGATLTEWAHTARRGMDVLDEVAGVPFERLTETYVACNYGKHVPTEEEVVPFAAYYLHFWQAARAYLGPLKYFFLSFRL